MVQNRCFCQCCSWFGNASPGNASPGQCQTRTEENRSLSTEGLIASIMYSAYEYKAIEHFSHNESQDIIFHCSPSISTVLSVKSDHNMSNTGRSHKKTRKTGSSKSRPDSLAVHSGHSYESMSGNNSTTSSRATRNTAGHPNGR